MTAEIPLGNLGTADDRCCAHSLPKPSDPSLMVYPATPSPWSFTVSAGPFAAPRPLDQRDTGQQPALLHLQGLHIPVPRLTWQIVTSALLMGGFLVLVQPRGRPETVGVTVAAGAIYLAALWVFRAADSDKRALIRRALRRA